MRLNNKGFAITGILYTVFIMFLLVLTSTLAGLQSRKTMLERSIMSLENSFNGNDNNEQELIRKINENKTAPVTGRYTFVLNTTLFSNNSTTFDRVGEHEFIAPTTGTYKLEVWGAQGGDANATYLGGKGGYSSGNITLAAGDKLYINVGGRGYGGQRVTTGGTILGGYNGGQNITYGTTDGLHYVGAGGGATHIATKSGTLASLSSSQSDVKIVAGGGGGAYYHTSGYYGQGGVGGGTTGGTGGNGGNSTRTGCGGGTQSAGGTCNVNGTFGQGAVSANSGGGGWYGGGAASGGNANYGLVGAGGGSGYIDGVTNGITISGDAIMPSYDGKKTMIGNEGNGYAKITLLDDSENSGNIICTAYLEKGTNLSEGNKITFIPSSCNDYTYHFSFNMTSDSNINDNIMYLTKIYSFEGDNK